MFWLAWSLAGLGLFMVANVLIASIPAYQRWLQRCQERDARRLEESTRQLNAAIKEAILRSFWSATEPAGLPRKEKPYTHVSPAVHRVES